MTDEELDHVVNSMDPGKVYEIGRRAGLREGIRRYAWWKDGVQYVGTCGTTLKKALDDIEREP